MTDNEKTSMKDVQEQYFLFKATIKVTKMT